MIRGCDLANDTVDSANLDGRPGSLCASREDRASGVGVRKDQRPAGRLLGGHFAGILGTMMGLSAARRRFNCDERRTGAEGHVDGFIAHGARSVT